MKRGGSTGWMREAGFSLFELILVLFLAGLMAALVVPSFSGPLESARLRSGAAEVRATLALARTLAASGARERAVGFDLDKGEYRVAGEARSRLLPEGIRFESVIVAGVEASRSASVRFFPDGGGEDAVIDISSSGGGRMRVTVDPLTGLAEAGT